MQLPVSQQVNTASLARIFDNKSESYKLFWFKAILHQVGQGDTISSVQTGADAGTFRGTTGGDHAARI